MPRETITVQVYPDDSIINRTIAEYERFGWEVISNQRMQEFTGQTSYGDGSSANHYSTFNKITFSRDKDAAWYEEVKECENRYKQLLKEKEDLQDSLPSDRYPGERVTFPKLSLILFVTPLFIVPIVLLIVYGIRKKGYKKRAAEWERTQKDTVRAQIVKMSEEIEEKQAQKKEVVKRAEIAMKTNK